jgi:hypothetical protein
MNLKSQENDLFRKTLCFGDVILSPKVKELNERLMIQLFGKIQEFLFWRNEAVETHSFGIIEVAKKRYIFSISKEGSCRNLNIRKVGEFF